ncbi:MAG: adenosylcobinamide-GDP ribazoletransferase [Nocardioidaceae bacterium]|nr:adenosylcobinamide-GDP ribazoletransferase [Nocardioidaceae bacterium]
MTASFLGRGLRLAIGTLTAIRVPVVHRVSPADARSAMTLAPLAAVPLGVVVGLVCWAGARLELPAVSVAFVALALLGIGSRALHLDGLSDVADGLTSSYDPERSLAVMKSGTAGPAGAAALVLVLGIQAGGLMWLAVPGDLHAALIAGLAVCVSRAALWITCCTLIPPARKDGLGLAFTQSVPVPATVLGWVVLAGLAAFVDPVRGPLTVAAAAAVVVMLVIHTVRRFGGVTGDVFGAGIELALAVLLIGAAGTV